MVIVNYLCGLAARQSGGAGQRGTARPCKSGAKNPPKDEFFALFARLYLGHDGEALLTLYDVVNAIYSGKWLALHKLSGLSQEELVWRDSH